MKCDNLEVTSAAREVDLGLEGEDGEGEDHGRRGTDCHQDGVGGVECGHRPQHAALTHWKTAGVNIMSILGQEWTQDRMVSGTFLSHFVSKFSTFCD